MFKTRRFYIGVIVSVVFLVLFFYKVDFQELIQALQNANYLYVILGGVIYFVAIYLRTVRWRYILSPLGEFSIKKLYPVVVVGYTANNLMPVRLGEFVRAYYLGEKQKIGMSATLATILIERVYDGLALIFFVALSVPILIATGALVSVAGTTAYWLIIGVFTAVIFVLAIVVITVLAITPRAMVIVMIPLSILPERIRSKALGIVDLFIYGLSCLKSPRRHAWIFLFSIMVWALEAFVYLLIGLAFHLEDLFNGTVLIAAMMLMTASANLISSIPASQGGIGPFEYVAATTLELVGVATEIGRAYVLALHLVVLIPVTLAGLIYLWWDNFTLAQLVGRSGVPNNKNG